MSAFRPASIVTTLFRVVVGLLFLLHGLASVFGVFGGETGTGEALPVGSWPGWWAGFIQLVGGLLVLVGLATRVAALVASGSMAYAYFSVHQPMGLLPLNNGGETPALFCWSFLLIAVLGPGRWSLDALLFRRARAPRAPRTKAALKAAPRSRSLRVRWVERSGHPGAQGRRR